MSRTTVLLVCLLGVWFAAAPSAQDPPKAGSATAKISLNGSTAYARPTDVALKTALLVGTSRWDRLAGRSPRGTAVSVADVNVVLSNMEFGCDTAYASPTPADDGSFVLVAGAILVFPETGDWTATPLGKSLADEARPDAEHKVDRFGFSLGNNKKGFSKEEVKANQGEFVLTRRAQQWSARIRVRDSKGSVEADVPLTTCAMPARTANVLDAKRPKTEPVVGPMLGMMAVLSATMRY